MGTWKAIPGFDMYEVSDEGEVRATELSLKGARMRKVRSKRNGYLEVNLWDRSTRTYRFFLIHRLVLTTFVGPPATSDMQARHLDGCRANNRLSNLAWGSRKENAADKTRHGTELLGENTNSAKLTEEQVRRIRRHRAAQPGRKWGRGKLAAELGVHPETVSRVATGEWWSHVR